MPQITSGSYNLGNSRQSARSNSFNRRNSVEFANQQNIIAERLRLVNEAKLLKQKQLANRPKLAILFNPTTYSPDALKLMEFIKDDTVVSKFTIIYYTDLLKTLEEQYNLGFRFFASPTIGSFSLYTYCIPFCKKYPDALLITTYSTQYFENGILPFNIIRTSINDKDMMHYIVNEILYKVNTLTKESAPLYYKPISDNTDSTYPIFEKIVYIYTEKDADGNLDTYSEGYKEQLLNEVNSQNGRIEIQTFKITDDNFILPAEVKTLLSENPVSGVDFGNNVKTMFILNSYNPEKILQLFDEEYMYNNYFIFGDVFPSNHYTSKYKFNYAICPIGNYSFEGYKTAGFLPGGRELSPFLYSIMDIILKLLPYYTQNYYKYPNFSSNQFNLYFINRMKEIKLFVDDNYWYERKIFTYYIGTKPDDLSNAQYNYYIFFQFKFNPELSGSISTQKTFIYSYINTGLKRFDKNLHIPIINASSSFTTYDINIYPVNSSEIRVNITFDYLTMNGDDGLSFIDLDDTTKTYYQDNIVTILQFGGMPLSRGGNQFANLSNLRISATDTPTILKNTSLDKAFYNCTNFNANISSWDVSNAKTMNSMFENSTNFNNDFSPLNWNCDNLTSAVNFGLNSSLYGLGGNYNVNPGNGTRKNNITSIETPMKTLTQSNSSLPLISGSFIFTISDLQLFDTTKIPIINSISFILLEVSQTYVSSFASTTVTILYSYNILLGNEGLSFKDVISYYGNKIVTILQFGGIPLSRGGEQFANLPNLVISAVDKPTILLNTSLNKAFYNSTNFNSNISSWNVSNVTNMTSMFENAIIFNQNISGWNVSNVTNMTSMFQNSTAFNNNNTLMNWSCNSNLVANKFGDGSALYVNNGGTYIGNFGNASRSNKTLSIQTPIYKNAGNLVYSFINTAISSDFDNSKIPIINNNNSFDILDVIQDISGNITTITVLYKILSQISVDDGFSFKNVANYYINGNVNILQFDNIPLSKAGEQFINLRNLAISTTYTDIPSIFNNTSLSKSFYNCTNFNSNINNWNVSNVTNMTSMFENAIIFNQDISSWNVSNVTNMSSMFYGCNNFNQNLSGWNVSKVTLMTKMFYGCSKFNQNLSSWNVSGVTNMDSVFQNATIFNNNNIPMNWNCNTNLSANNFGDGTALYTNTNNDYRKNAGNAKRLTTTGNKSIQTPIYNYGTFIYRTKVNIAITSNNISTYLPIIDASSSLITYNTKINRIGSIFTGLQTIEVPFYYDSIRGEDGLSFKNVTDKYGIFNITITQFDGIPLSNSGYQFWKLEDLNILDNCGYPTILPGTSLKQAFYQSTFFNSNISNWNVSEVTDMRSMFYGCIKFNQDISNWNVSKVTNMDSMFEGATDFYNKGIPMFWNCDNLTSATNFGLGSNLYEENSNFSVNQGNPGNAVRLSTNNIDYFSIETSIVPNPSGFGEIIRKYKLTPSQVTDLTTLKSGTFVYSFYNKNSVIFDSDIHLPIINNKSFSMLDINFVNDNEKKTTTVNVYFNYRFLFDDDGLTFKNVSSYYKNNLVEIKSLDGIPLSNYNNYKFFDIPDLKIACTSVTCPVITQKNLLSGVPIYFTELLYSTQLNIPQFCNKINVYLVGGGGSGGQGGGDGATKTVDGIGFLGKKSKEGTDGSGGGGGEFVSRSVLLSEIITPDTHLYMDMGSTAPGVPPENNSYFYRANPELVPASDDDGYNGFIGATTALRILYNNNNVKTTLLHAEPGTGGGGGSKDTKSISGIGGVNKINTQYTILQGRDSENKKGGLSGYYLFTIKDITGNYINKNKPGFFTSFLGDTFGNGGNGSEGKKDRNPRKTSDVKNNYARVYFIT
jgi:surface protein